MGINLATLGWDHQHLTIETTPSLLGPKVRPAGPVAVQKKQTWTFHGCFISIPMTDPWDWYGLVYFPT